MRADREAFAREWIEAWNAHDLERILSHYAEDIVLTSPIAARRLGDPRGTVRGKAALRDYFAQGLAARPDLRFALRRAREAFRNPAGWARLQVQAMRAEFSWQRSAEQYAEIFRELAGVPSLAEQHIRRVRAG